jgi:KDO2-lipid IV(A) lauroyltransferase
VYLAYRLAAALACVLPERSVEGVAAVLGWVGARLCRRRRRVVADTLGRVARSVPGSGVAPGAVDAAFASYARYWLETFRLRGVTRERLERGTVVRGLTHLKEARCSGRGVVIVTAHLGGWDFGGAWLAAHGYPATVVVETLDSVPLLEWFSRLRSDLGVTVVPHDARTLDVLREALADGRIVGLVCDRDLGRRGVEVGLFGDMTTLPAGPARLALEADVPVIPAAVYFRPDGGHEAVIRPPIQVPRSGDFRADVSSLTQAIATELEVVIAAEPTQWHLMQPNWLPKGSPGPGGAPPT